MGINHALIFTKDAEILFDEPMGKHTTYRLGGKAKYFVTPKTQKALINLLNIASEYDIPYFVLGNGSNLLVSDKGYKGLIINTKGLNNYRITDNFLTAECGVNLNKVILSLKDRGLSGLENLYTIPSTIGGAVCMNAGAFGSQIADCLKVVCVYKDGEVRYYDKCDCDFSYRNSIFQKNNGIIFSASFILNRSSPQEILDKIKCVIEKRKNLPKERTCGSVFRNPNGDFAGRLIESLSLKGFRSGGAQISNVHANYIVASNGAKALDVYNLITYVKDRVYKEYSIKLIEEVKFLGEF